MTTRIAIVLALTLLPATAAAFPTGEQFDLDPLAEDGGGGLAFDGAARFAGHTCAVCHTGAPGRIRLRLEADRPELFTEGWTPTTQYHLRVAIDHAWAASEFTADGDACGFNATPYHRCDENGFALEMDDLHDKPVGTFVPFAGSACAAAAAPTDASVRVLADGTAVTHNGAHMGVTQWDLCWTSPAAGAGVITAYLAAVDGNGGNGTEEFPNDTTGDDVAAGTVPLPESGSPAVRQNGGCAAGDRVGPGMLAVILALLVVRRRRRRGALAITVAIAIGTAGCVHVRPRQRGTLAHRNMRFAPDPTEDELDLHMQEAREGSSGGYGSSGGGCGCN